MKAYAFYGQPLGYYGLYQAHGFLVKAAEFSAEVYKGVRIDCAYSQQQAHVRGIFLDLAYFFHIIIGGHQAVFSQFLETFGWFGGMCVDYLVLDELSLGLLAELTNDLFHEAELAD
eukprot:TRINITY_DN1055_c0_g3_i2.p9 TRINITY_DN1055_c0_g3~~TRINITY_DN1055_c0_g3_i2.p9  ORF type:complete len:116 (-),score=2.18 TRINITY_DN1055_c0_g3_i2:530-877(-)